MKTILDILPHSKDFAITGKHIADQLNYKNDFEVRRSINYLRTEGHPICSNNHGYWLSDDPEEVLETIHDLEHRMESIAKAAGGLYHWYIEEGMGHGNNEN